MKLARTLVSLVAATATASVLSFAPAAAQEASPAQSQSAPTPAPSPCARPTVHTDSFWSVSPRSIAAGDAADISAVAGGRYDLCQTTRADHEFRLLATAQGRDPVEVDRRTVTTTNGEGYALKVYPTETTTYELLVDGQTARPESGPTVTVDRVSGSCANALTLYAGTSVSVGSPVLVNGSSSDTSTVSIAFRKRGQTAFSVRRQAEPAGQQGVFNFYFTADDDYRLFASNERCDSQPILVTAAPVITGPATVRKGSTVTLTVRATPGMPLAVAFRRAGQTTFTVRRTGTAASNGVYTTTYKADADYQYYAAERPGQQSERKITQAR